jgi:single-stranded DNA-binding protein
MMTPVYTNRVVLIGRVSRVADVRRTARGTVVANLKLVTILRDERQEEHRLVIWGRCSEQARECVGLCAVKSREWELGRWLRVEGHISSRVWTDSRGSGHETVEVICDLVEALDAPPPPPPPRAKPKLEVVVFTQVAPEGKQ